MPDFTVIEGNSAPQKKLKAKQKRKPGRPRIERIHHIVEIRGWKWDFMFGINDTSFLTGPYSDFRHLVIKGALLRPADIKAKEAELTLFPDRFLMESAYKSTDTPKPVGCVTHRGISYSANLHVPADALNPILQMMIAGRYTYILFEAEKSYRGEASIRHYRFAATLAEDDLSA
jgi:hypothetical protein